MRLYIPILLIFSVILVSGCLGNDAILNMAKSSPEVQDFLSEYPDAQINVQLLKKESVQNDNDFIMRCSGSEASDYYKIMLTDEESGLNSFVFMDQEKGVICAFKEGGGKEESDEGCIEDWICSAWSECENGLEVRTCTDENECGTSGNKPSESRSCELFCFEDWECSSWSDCVNDVQMRTCTDVNDCGTVINKPSTSKSCVSCTCTCGEWSECYPGGYQTRSCSCSNCEPDEMEETMRDCVPETGACEEKYLEEFRCKDEKTVQKKYQLADCSIQWEDWRTCDTGYKCGSDEDPETQCRMYTCSEMGGEICGENEYCENNDFENAHDTYWCCVSSCQETELTCSERGGELCYTNYRKCISDPITQVSDDCIGYYCVCCPSENECVPKTCAERGEYSCSLETFCKYYNSAMASYDEEAGQLCCESECEPLPVCGNDICEYWENKSPTSFTSVNCYSNSITDPPVGTVIKGDGCVLNGCPEDC